MTFDGVVTYWSNGKEFIINLHSDYDIEKLLSQVFAVNRNHNISTVNIWLHRAEDGST